MSTLRTPEDPRKMLARQETGENIESLVTNLKPVLDVLARKGVKIEIVELEPETPLYFDYESSTCVINPNFLLKLGLTGPDEILFGCAHEVGHFVQALEDPDGYERLHSLIEERAEEMTEKILRKPEFKKRVIEGIKRDTSKDITPRKEEEAIEEVFRHVYHRLVNAVLDVNANTRIIRRMVPYQEGQPKANLPREIYKNKLFPSQKEGKPPNYQNDPYYAQFMYSLLRNYMTGEKATISEPVQDALNTLTAFGQTMGMEQFVREYIAEAKDNFMISVYLNLFILPKFEGLLWRDIEEDRFRVVIIESDFHGEGKGEIEPGSIKKWKEEKEKTDEEKHRDLEEKQFGSKLKELGFSQKEIEELLQIKRETQEVTDILKAIWYRFVREVSSIYLKKQDVYRYGVTPNINEVIKQLYIQEKPPQEAEVMERYVPEEETTLLPRTIKIVLILDLSSSMDEPKRQTVQRITYSLLHSLLTFQEELKVNFQFPDFPIGVEFKIIGFGGPGKTEELARSQQSTEEQLTKEKENINRAVLYIKKTDLGDTADDQALKLAREFFSQEDISKIRNKEVLGVVLEITDGETYTPDASKKEIEQINQLGVFCRAIQIPGPVYAEEPPEEGRYEPHREIIAPTDTFSKVWEDKGLKIENLSELPDIIIELLKEAIEEPRE